MSLYRNLVVFTCVLAFIAVVFTAFARLSDAGLGCTNWPDCYKESAVMQRHPTPEFIAQEHASWKWKFQNTVGALLGFLALGITTLAWLKRKELGQSPALAIWLLVLMTFLSVFGILAFKHLSRPVIVSVHLAGGVGTLMLLTWMSLQQYGSMVAIKAGEGVQWCKRVWLGIVLLLIQIMLGGWESSNYAALACGDFPLCNGALLPMMDFSYTPVDVAPLLTTEQLVGIHWLHRTTALITVAYLAWLAIKTMAVPGLQKTGLALRILVASQLVLGVANIWLGLPLIIAILHNAIAMALLVVLMVISYRFRISKD
jgi:cytochrome c oxidase assembly protein subunit 15